MDQRVKDGWGDNEDRSNQLRYLITKGLHSNMYLMDFGCGPLAAGIHFIDYLDSGHYSGVDISAESISKGQDLLHETGLASKVPALYVLDSSNRYPYTKEKFDFIWVQSVFTHMPLCDLTSTLASFKPCISPKGRIFANFNIGSNDGSWSSGGYKDNNFSYRVETIEELAVGLGFELNLMNDWDHPVSSKQGQDRMFLFTLSSQ